MKCFVSLCNLNFSKTFHVQNESLIFFEQTFNLLSECFTFHFQIQYLGCPNNIKYQYLVLGKSDIKYVTSWSFDCDLKSEKFVISQYSCTTYFIVCVKN